MKFELIKEMGNYKTGLLCFCGLWKHQRGPNLGIVQWNKYIKVYLNQLWSADCTRKILSF